MTRHVWSTMVVAGLILSGVALPGRTRADPPKAKETPGEYLDDTFITTKVKAALLEDETLKSFQISVKTYKDVVQLSGFVDTAQAVKRAGQLASGIKGVAVVKNDLIVK